MAAMQWYLCVYYSATDGGGGGERAFSQGKDYGQALGQAKSGEASWLFSEKGG